MKRALETRDWILGLVLYIGYICGKHDILALIIELLGIISIVMIIVTILKGKFFDKKSG